MFKKILAPVDGSPHARSAVKMAAALAKQFGSELILVHVSELKATPMMAGDFIGYTAGMFDQIMEQLSQMGSRVLEEAKTIASPQKVSTRLIMGSAVSDICDTAKRENCDLIVMGSRGVSDLKGLFLGSVSHGVLQRSACPVLLVK